jgi:hypothetical protein
MSTALVTALRESCGYLRDGGYEQTAELMEMAAAEIERLNRRVHALETDSQTPTASRRPLDRLRQYVGTSAAPASLTDFDPRRRSK